MELYTLVSLVIGVFGAAYAALNSLRINIEPKLKKAADTAQSRLDAFVKVRGQDNGAVRHCTRHREKIKVWHWVWVWANIVPAIAFFLCILTITSAVLVQWNQVVVIHKAEDLAVLRETFPWSWSKGLLMANGILNFLCVGAAILAWRRCCIADDHLQEHTDGLDAPEGITPS